MTATVGTPPDTSTPQAPAVPRRHRAVARPRQWYESLPGPDRAALQLWLWSRVSVFLLVGASVWLFAAEEDARQPVQSFLDRWVQWDVVHYETIALHGYGGHPITGQLVPLEAFFPGLPMLLRALDFVGINLTLAGLLISFVAGAIAVVALARLGAREAGPAAGSRAVLLLVLSPSAIFLAAGYTEALFLAFALPAWLAARRGSWMAAGLLAACASTTRITGVFLAAALAVEFLTANDGRRRWRSAPWLLVPLVPVAAYMVYLHSRTGDWLAWQHAQERGWYRTFTDPWTALSNTWSGAFGGGQTVSFAWMFRAEMVAVLIGLALTVWLLRRRRWGEATFVGMQVVAFATSYWYFSVPRSTLLWWPLWIGLAAWSLRRPQVLTAYFAVVAPFMVVLVLLFSLGRWAG